MEVRIDIRGWVRTSLIDFPGHIATVFFTGGCDFRCPMCHNGDLVLRPAALPAVSPEAMWDFLSRRRGKVTGVVVSGGEPTLQPDLGDFLKGVRNLGYAVKLDTNGHRPDALVALLDAGLVDYVAMDIKGPPAKYGRSAGMPDLDVTRIAASIARLAQGAVAHEFRTTVVPGLLDGDDIEAIARWVADLGGEDDRYILQQFRNAHTLDPSLRAAVPYPREVLEEMTERAGRRVTKVSLRGV